MMEFLKWSSIENHYRTKEIARWTEQFPKLLSVEYILTEKIHGSNIIVAASPDGEIRFGSRNQWLEPTEAFFGCFPRDLGSLIPYPQDEFREQLLWMAKDTGKDVRLYGELFGPGIQKGIDYGDKKRILWFGLKYNDELQPFAELWGLFAAAEIVPVVRRVWGLQAALDFDIEFNSVLSQAPDNPCEGIVICPVNPVHSQDSWFMLKKKNEKFAERAHAKKERIPDEIADPLNEAFRTYITPARMQSVFSKDGPIEDRKDIGRYIKAILADAKEDFLKDYPEAAGLDKAQQKAVFNVGSMIAKMLMAEM